MSYNVPISFAVASAKLIHFVKIGLKDFIFCGLIETNWMLQANSSVS